MKHGIEWWEIFWGEIKTDAFDAEEIFSFHTKEPNFSALIVKRNWKRRWTMIDCLSSGGTKSDA